MCNRKVTKYEWGETMEERLKQYLKYMKELQESGNLKELSDEQRAHLRQELLVQIGFFQHERLVHLIVTITFAILTMLVMLGCFLTDTPAMLVLTLLCLVLLVPYVRHYYILENGVQRLYRDYDALNRK